jgi:hypothetical protein
MDLDQALEECFKHMSTSALIRRMERAEDFGYDDESIELTRRLRREGKAWRWKSDSEVEIFTLPAEAAA